LTNQGYQLRNALEMAKEGLEKSQNETMEVRVNLRRIEEELGEVKRQREEDRERWEEQRKELQQEIDRLRAV
jgi:uncharacterized protein (DUF305 family)